MTHEEDVDHPARPEEMFVFMVCIISIVIGWLIAAFSISNDIPETQAVAIGNGVNRKKRVRNLAQSNHGADKKDNLKNESNDEVDDDSNDKSNDDVQSLSRKWVLLLCVICGIILLSFLL